jgi:hypothetical protein
VSEQRFVTDRALLLTREMRLAGDLSEHSPMLGYRYDSILVVCTRVDLEDPRIRTWLELLPCRLADPTTSIRLEIR